MCRCRSRRGGWSGRWGRCRHGARCRLEDFQKLRVALRHAAVDVERCHAGRALGHVALVRPVRQQANAVGFHEVGHGLRIGQGENGEVVVGADHGRHAHHGVDLRGRLGRVDLGDLRGCGLQGHDGRLRQRGRADHGLDVVGAKRHGHGVDHAHAHAGSRRIAHHGHACGAQAVEPGRHGERGVEIGVFVLQAHQHAVAAGGGVGVKQLRAFHVPVNAAGACVQHEFFHQRKELVVGAGNFCVNAVSAAHGDDQLAASIGEVLGIGQLAGQRRVQQARASGNAKGQRGAVHAKRLLGLQHRVRAPALEIRGDFGSACGLGQAQPGGSGQRVGSGRTPRPQGAAGGGLGLTGAR